MNQTRTLLLHDYGGYAFSLQLAEELARHGWRVHYLHGGDMQAVQRSRSEVRHPGLTIDSARIKGAFARYSLVKRWQQEREYGQSLARKAAQIGPHVILSGNCPLDSQDYLLRYAKKSATPFVLWWQDVVSLATASILSRRSRLLGWLVGGYYQGMERAQLKASQRVVAISDAFRQPYRAWGLDEHKLRVIPNWASVEEIPLLARDNRWSQQFGLTDKFVFMYSGVLALKHDPGLLLGLADHFQNRPEVRVVVISQGPGADWLESHPRPNLLILPFQPYEQYPLALASADVLVAAVDEHSGLYSVPSKTLTYLCAGKPVLLSAPEENQAFRLIHNQQAGLAAPPWQVERFFHLAQLLYENAEMRQQFGLNARAHAEKHFVISTIGAQFEEILSQFDPS
jgi:glycosyltransferase involved in cell wall biosynthesis